jgi:hypothetical protein
LLPSWLRRYGLLPSHLLIVIESQVSGVGQIDPLSGQGAGAASALRGRHPHPITDDLMRSNYG